MQKSCFARQFCIQCEKDLRLATLSDHESPHLSPMGSHSLAQELIGSNVGDVTGQA